MIDHPARFLFVGAATKTGKTVALELRAARAILNGEPVAWSGSVLAKTKKTYRRLKQILEKPIEAGVLTVNDSAGTIYDSLGNPVFTSFTGEHPEAIYGDAYKHFIIDEASRQPQAVFTAAVTTTSATRGSVVCAFNLDHGARNWAVAKMLQIQRMTDEERAALSQDSMTFPTAGEPWVTEEDIELARTSGMPRVLFEALYLAKVPEEDVSLFSNLETLWTGPAPSGPESGHTYICGIDLGRKQDFTVATVLDTTSRRFVASLRLYKIGWTLQYERALELYRRWRCSKAWVDQSGLGDPVVAELEERGMAVEGYVFTETSRKTLIETFSAACDGKRFTVADIPELQVHRDELGSFEITVSRSAQAKVTYRAPEGGHDDAAFSMMLAWFGAEQGTFGTPIIMPFSRSDAGDGYDVDLVAIGGRDYSGY